jgi:peptide/nickel transport system substrate-binding protein
MATNTAAVPDPYYYLTRSYQTGGANNYVNYSNPALDSMLNKSLATLDTNTRYGILEEVQSIAQNEATNIVVAYYGMVAAYNDHVKGFKYDPTAHDYRLSPEMYIEK